MQTIKITLLLGFVCFSTLLCFGQNKENKEVFDTSKFNLRFLDENTGILVIPENVEIKQRKDPKIIYNINMKQITQNGTVSVQVADGIYDITVNAQGYAPMTTFFQMNNQTLNVNFNLVPLKPLKELSSEFIKSLHKSGSMAIVGFVVDDSIGKPLDKVEVYTADKIVTTFTNATGFFQLIIPLAEKESEIEKRYTIFFRKVKYSTEIRQKFDVWSNGDMIFGIRMKNGTGLNRVNVLQIREPNIEILNNANKTINK